MRRIYELFVIRRLCFGNRSQYFSTHNVHSELRDENNNSVYTADGGGRIIYRLSVDIIYICIVVVGFFFLFLCPIYIYSPATFNTFPRHCPISRPVSPFRSGRTHFSLYGQLYNGNIEYNFLFLFFSNPINLTSPHKVHGISNVCFPVRSTFRGLEESDYTIDSVI